MLNSELFVGILNAAAEEYFAKGLGGPDKSSKAKKTSGPSDSARIQTMFNSFKDGESGKMEAEGIQSFYAQVGIDAEKDLVTFLISYYMKAQTMGSHTFEEFQQLFHHLGVASLDDIKKKVP